MEKKIITFKEIRNNGIRLAQRIAKEWFIPDIIYVSLRGGAPLGNVISEVFKLIRPDNPVFYAAVVARSYTDIRQSGQIHVDGWTYSPKWLRPGDKILLIDDIFDSGRTLNYLVDVILSKGIPRENIKVVVHDYKKFTNKEMSPITPDFYINKYTITSPEDDFWIHYQSHELQGLTESELEMHYYDDDPGLKDVMKDLRF